MDLRALDARYRALQARLHPDKFALRCPREQAFSAEQSAAVNKAHQTLRTPLTRGFYMLNMLGCPVSPSDQLADKAFLMEIMEVRGGMAKIILYLLFTTAYYKMHRNSSTSVPRSSRRRGISRRWRASSMCSLKRSQSRFRPRLTPRTRPRPRSVHPLLL